MVVLLPTTYENGRQSDKHLWFEGPIIFKDRERTSTFSQEMRALNPVRTVVMEILVYDMRPRVCVLCLGCFGWFELTLYFVTSLLMPPFLRYYFA